MTNEELILLGPFRLMRSREFPQQWVMRSRVGEDVAFFEDELFGAAVVEMVNVTWEEKQNLVGK